MISRLFVWLLHGHSDFMTVSIPGAGGLGFYLSNIVAIVQSDGLGKEMAVHTALPE